MGCYRRRGLLGRITRADRDEIRTRRRTPGGHRPHGTVVRRTVGRAAPTGAGRPGADRRRRGLLLLDEPITGLDLPSQETILRIIDEEVARGATVVFSTHHLEEAKRADRVMLLAGCVIADGVRPRRAATRVPGDGLRRSSAQGRRRGAARRRPRSRSGTTRRRPPPRRRRPPPPAPARTRGRAPPRLNPARGRAVVGTTTCISGGSSRGVRDQIR